MLSEIVKIVKKRVSIPVIAKMPCQDTSDTIKAVTAAGIDALSGPHFRYSAGLSARAPRSTPIAIDIYNGGKSLVPGISKGRGHHLGVGGPRRAITNWWASVVAQTVKLPLISQGGLRAWQHVVEAIMWGATAVGFQTLIMQQGFEILDPMGKALERFMDKQGYSSLKDLRGIALKYISDEPIEFEPLAANVNEEKCDGCMECTRIGHCIAIDFSREKRKATVNPDKYYGCCWCTWKCPRNAITMISYPKPFSIETYLLS